MNSLMVNSQHFFHMGGYGFYVWSAYFCLFIILLMNIILPLKCFRKTKKKLSISFTANDSANSLRTE